MITDGGIRDYKAETVEIQEEVERFVCETDQSRYSAQMMAIKKVIEKSEPSLMFYGIYNAGKSTLLNAIFGKEVASVNDIPETHKVTLYEWGKYTLADTPGLNGPPEDEQVTAAEICRHDIIMFVIDDSDNFDSDVITRKIIEILQTGKPCIIVINKKNASDKERILAIKAKMNKNIEMLSPIAQNYEFVDVDAETALKAKKGQKNRLLEESNIRELEYCISNRLASIESVKLLRVPLEMIAELCKEIQDCLEKEVQNENSRKLYKLKETIFQTKEWVWQEFTIALAHMVDEYANDIYRQVSENRQSEIQEDAYERQIQELAQKYLDKFSEGSNSALRQFQETCKMNLSLGTIPQEEIECKTSCRKAEKDDLDELLDSLEKLPILIPTPGPTPIPLPVVVGVVKALKKWIFGSGNREVQDVDEWNRQQEEYAQRRMMALRELKNQIAIQMGDFRERINKAFAGQLEKAYGEAVAEIDRTLKEIEGKSQDRIWKQECAADIMVRVRRLLKEIA